MSFETQKAVVWVQDLATGERRMLANFRGSNSAPAWSPDGRELARDAVAATGWRSCYLMPARRRRAAAPDHAARPSTPSRVRARRPAASTSSATAAAARRSTACRAGGGSAERVTFTGNYNISPAISPDGRMLAYITRQGGGLQA